ncbi:MULTISPECIES: hypothetical protein [unclassified Acinetobacter]|uniref:hypothetical protein n=1 Tax=unclassified Acinetobacter TaxID=196816 RepID=UPI0005C7228A|nr:MULTISPECIES: hypothetical protein [unclassified Acinetobacter]
MTIPQIKTPGTYLEVNINTQRTGLPDNRQRIIFITDDNQPTSNNGMPISIYDKAHADLVYGTNSVAGRMISAAIKTNRFADVQCLGKTPA